MRIPVALLLLVIVAAGQDAPFNGPRRITPGWHALVNATVHTKPGETLESATVLIRNGRIAAVGKVELAAGARIWDCRGLQVYAGFIDAHVAVEPEPNKPRHWNPKVTPKRIARAIPGPVGSELRALGFTAAVAAPKSGILRGRASLVSLAPALPDRSEKRPAIYAQDVYQAIGFERFRGSDEGYPTSLMGAIAVIRQSLYDGLVEKARPLLFDCADELNALRAARIAREFRRSAVLLGSGLEFRRLDAIAKDGLAVILPVRLPPPPDVASVGARHRADLRELMTWETAPSNARLLADAGVRVSLTTSRLKRRSEFFKQLEEMRGLDEKHWLAMLTTNPAKLLGVDDSMGTVETGRLANLCVWAGPAGDKGSKVVSVWIDGEHHEVGPRPGPVGEWDLAGKRLGITAQNATLDKAKATRFERRGDAVDMVFGGIVYSGRFGPDGSLGGHATRPDGTRVAWSATRVASRKKPAKKEKAEAPIVRPRGYPFGPYAQAELAPQQSITFVGATVWTSGPQGILENGQVEVREGKIAYVGKRRPATGLVVDLKGRHVTPGIIDCHSHTGISGGVNDSGQAVTAEVRIGDVTNPDSISWYRQLAGGVTTVNNLHGSANPIGGQSQTNKIRWGVRHPDAMHFEGAMPGIKFALGENVKQSNWGDKFTTRYPQTRMGVETLMRDRFLAAREYKDSKHERTDLELEALAEILEGKRLVHCHSYRQDEILMLCRIAGEFNFKIGTFQHILEGYKVAEVIREHAIGASAFSDWWAYKVEVQDAIPFNGAIMHRAGVNVSFNSDSDDLARRLNIEAAKAVKYGGLKRAEAFRFVTINPAIQLGIAKRAGSLEAGKDADLVIWSGDPLSPYSVCLSTWIDGREYFSVDKDRAHRVRIANERQRLIAAILKQPEKKARGKRKAAGGDNWWINRFEGADCGVCGVQQR